MLAKIASLHVAHAWIPSSASKVSIQSAPTLLSRTYSSSTSTALFSSRNNHVNGNSRQSPSPQRRRQMLARNGPHFVLDSWSGNIEFGATANLVTRLDVPYDDSASVAEWLADERALALSIWDPSLVQERGNSVYRLQLMTLKFVTLQLAPWVDVYMKTVYEDSPSSGSQQPVFTLQSVAFDPNVQIIPGKTISAESLGIVIEVVGELRPSPQGVQGGIAFQTTGKLPVPLRILPASALRAAADTINNTIVKFAVRNFQAGAQKKYREYVRQKQQQLKQQEASAAPTQPSSF
jgi:hypothetical protein